MILPCSIDRDQDFDSERMCPITINLISGKKYSSTFNTSLTQSNHYNIEIIIDKILNKNQNVKYFKIAQNN